MLSMFASKKLRLEHLKTNVFNFWYVEVVFQSALFPVGLKTDASIYGPVSERELNERPESIPRYFPAVHPEWCAGHGTFSI